MERCYSKPVGFVSQTIFNVMFLYYNYFHLAYTPLLIIHVFYKI